MLSLNILETILLSSILAYSVGEFRIYAKSLNYTFFQIDGRLESDDLINAADGSWYDQYFFRGNVDQSLTVILESRSFDTYLILLDANNNPIAQNDDISQNNRNSRVTLTLPNNGIYTIIVNSYEPDSQGRYTLSIEDSTINCLSKTLRPNLPQNYLDIIESVNINNLNSQYIYQEQLVANLTTLEQALKISQDNCWWHEEGRLLHEIAMIYEALENYSQTLEYLQTALSIRRDINNPLEESRTLRQMGIIYSHLTQYDKAIAYYSQSLDIQVDLEAIGDAAKTLNNMGVAHDQMGQYYNALSYYQQALIAFQDIADSIGEGITLNNIGETYHNLGQYSSAIDHYQQALDTFYELDIYRWSGIIFNNIGRACADLAYHIQISSENGTHCLLDRNFEISNSELVQYLPALRYYQQALVIHQRTGDRTAESDTLDNIGLLYSLVGEYEQALENYQKALSIRQELNNQLGIATSFNNIGLTYTHLEKHTQATDYYQQSLEISQIMGDRSNIGISFHNLGYLLLKTQQFLQAEDYLFQALDIWESLRDIKLDTLDQVSLLETQQSTYKLLQETLVSQEKYQSALNVSERSRARILLQQLNQLLTNKLEQKLAIEAPTIQDIQHIAQTQNSLLIEYSITNDNQIYIWVIQPNGTVIFRSVDITNHNLAQMVKETRISLGARNRSTPDNSQGQAITIEPKESSSIRAFNEQLQTLYQLLIDPVADLLPDSADTNIIFIPHGKLFLVPFPALMDKNGTYLIEKHTVLTAPSIQILDLTRTQRNRIRTTETPNSTALVVGNPTMPTVYFPGPNRYDTLSPLPGTEQEARAIAQILGTLPIIGDAATEAAMKQQMASAEFIHLATHGLLEYGDPKTFGRRDIPGAMTFAPGHGDDGLLTAAEILGLDLNANMVVLSACDTGLGNITGDGVIGLSRSFIAAGVPSIIVSLWAVPDASTAELMTTFYQKLNQGQTKAQALRQAMLTTMATHPDPINWAAFTLIGEAE
ncbi:MAG: CHAT domain-containing protein [Cyanobacteria bacterium P01_F01_bin.150]